MESLLQLMMLQMQKKQKSNLNFHSIIFKSLVAFFATGLLVVNMEAKDLSSTKSKTLLLKHDKGLSNEEYDQFILGRSFFTIPWVEAPSATTARDGLGPHFNANTCASCHPNNGRGNLFNKKGQISRSLIAKVSIKNDGSKLHKELKKKHGLVPEPTYGGQIAINAIHGVKFEAKPHMNYEEIKVEFPDGEIDTIYKPTYKLKELGYGELHKDTIITFRLAPSLNGLGLLEDIADETILKNVDETDKNNDGISGRANFAYSPITKKLELGRYSWKASNTSIKHQTADAAINDMGLTSSLFSKDRCTKFQKDCLNAPKARDAIDITNMRLDAMDYYLRNRVSYSAKKTSSFKEGLEIFKTIGCAKCHKDSMQTKSGIKISPFSDLLLHDMGEGLADGRSEFLATGKEWRTPPLWGLALHEKINGKKPKLLHDGRANDFQEAILWHGGEASGVKKNYMNLNKEMREKLLKFLEEV